MAVRQTDSEPSAEESAEESTGESACGSQATESAGNTDDAGTPAAREAARAGNAADVPAVGYAAAVRAEQEYVTMLYDLLDQARERSRRELAGVRAGGGAGGTHQARLERDISAAEHAQRIAQLDLTERGLCFGRTDDEKRNTLYIGRIGLRDDDYELKLIDWRAPAARPFYAATPRNPVGLVRRRHIYTRRRAVTGVDDEVFDLDKLSEADRSTLSGEAALIAAVSSARTGRMADVVATIQAEQDRVIRADLPGVLVVQGGPGTGKTVAALHRAAYLLYTHRRVLERRGVLVIGPNATFLRYISQVLPSLGETDVVLHTLGDLFPGVHATDTRDPAAVIKGDERMVRVLQQAVRDRQAVPKRDIIVNAEGVDVPLAPRGDPARPRPGPLHPQAAQRGPQALRHRAAHRPRPGRGPGAQPPARRRGPARRPRPPVGLRRCQRRARRAVAAAHPGNAAGRPAAVAASDQVRRWFRLGSFRTGAAYPPGSPVSLDGGGRPAARRGRRAARRRRLRAAGGAPRGRARPPRRAGVRAGGTRLGHRPGHGVLHDGEPARHARRRAAVGLELGRRRGVLHRRARRRRPDLGLRPRDHRRGAGAVPDGVADGAAAQPGPLHDRGRRRGADRLARRRYLVEGHAHPAGRPPLARGAPHGQLPHPERDHGGRGRRPRLRFPGRAAAGLGSLRGRSPGGGPGRRRWPGRLRGRPRARGPGRDRRRGRGPPGRHRAGRAGRLARAARSPRPSPATSPSRSTPRPRCLPSPRPRASSSTG